MEEHRCVIRQDKLLRIEDVERELKAGKLRKHIKAGGLFCSEGHCMTFVICENKRNHFRHVCLPAIKGGSNIIPSGSGGCSSRHLEAQALLRDHDYRVRPVEFGEFRACKRSEHTKVVFTAAGDVDVKLEVRESSGKFITDVLFYKHRVETMRVEVFATHKTKRSSRVGIEFVAVAA